MKAWSHRSTAFAAAMVTLLLLAGCDDEVPPVESWLPPVAAPAMRGIAVRSGDSFRLDDQRGKVLLVAFGYTSCADVCPLTLRTFGSVARRLERSAAVFLPLYVSVDPQRDTPGRFRAHLEPFHPRIEGLFIEDDELPAVLDRWGITARRRAADLRAYVGRDIDPTTFYSMDHTASLWLIDAEGRLRVRYAYGAGADIIAASAERLIRELEVVK